MTPPCHINGPAASDPLHEPAVFLAVAGPRDVIGASPVPFFGRSVTSRACTGLVCVPWRCSYPPLLPPWEASHPSVPQASGVDEKESSMRWLRVAADSAMRPSVRARGVRLDLIRLKVPRICTLVPGSTSNEPIGVPRRSPSRRSGAHTMSSEFFVSRFFAAPAHQRRHPYPWAGQGVF